MEDYDGEGVPDSRVKQVSIIFSEIPIRKKKREMTTKKTIVCLMHYAPHITKPICLVY
jgi:hypothetical protein